VRDLPLLPPLVDMERALAEMPPALVFLDRGADRAGFRWGRSAHRSRA